MTKEQAAAYVFSQSVCALATIEGMKAENAIRALNGYSPAWNDSDFEGIAEQFGIGHNAVIELYQKCDS